MADALAPRFRQGVDLAELTVRVRIAAREAPDKRDNGAFLLEDESVALGVRKGALPPRPAARHVDPGEPLRAEHVLVRRLPRPRVHLRDRGGVLRRGAPNRYLPAFAETYFATAMICASESLPLNAGITPPPTST